MIINAEGWYVLRLPRESQTSSVTYRIFASWRIDDRWRLSSGAASFDRLIFDGSKFIWPQISGNIYYLPLDGESGATFYTANILDRYLSEIGVSLEHVRVRVTELASWASSVTRNIPKFSVAEDFDYDSTFYEFYALCGEYFHDKREAIVWFDTVKIASFGQLVPREVVLKLGMTGMVAVKDYLSAKAQGSFE